MEDDQLRPVARWWVDASGMARVWVDPMLEEALCFKPKRGLPQEIALSTMKEVEELMSCDEEPSLNELPQGSENAPSNLTQDPNNAHSKLTIQKKTSASPTARMQLYEICSANHWDRPSFILCGEDGPGHHDKLFTFKVIVLVEGVSSKHLECFSKPMPNHNAAREHAAEGALWYLKHLGYSSQR